MLKKRLTERVKIISHFEAALQFAEPDALKEYVKTLDIKKLGDISTWEEQPSIFTIDPLRVKYEYLMYDPDASSFWMIFATHVKNITNMDFELKFDGDKLDDSMRDYFTPELVQNISSIIIKLANRGGMDVFFSPPPAFWDFILSLKLHRASVALLEGVKIKKQKPAKSKLKTGTQQNSE